MTEELKNCPCKDCTDRVIGCHANCDSYKKWTEERNAHNKVIFDAKQKQQIYLEYKKSLKEHYLRRTKK